MVWVPEGHNSLFSSTGSVDRRLQAYPFAAAVTTVKTLNIVNPASASGSTPLSDQGRKTQVDTGESAPGSSACQGHLKDSSPIAFLLSLNIRFP